MPLPEEQYLFRDTSTVTDNGVTVNVPPLYHEVVTAKLKVARSKAELMAARNSLGGVLAHLEAERLLTFTPGGLGLAVGWGLSYFERYLPAPLTAARIPRDLTAPHRGGARPSVLLPSTKFASDPDGVILEENDVVFVMASDSASHLATAYEALFSGKSGHLFTVTSRRKGFIDATVLDKPGEKSLTKKFATALKLPGHELIPNRAELFLGFTSTQAAADSIGPIANFEALGMTDQGPRGYFSGGTILALSHLFEDLELWYGSNSYRERVDLAFRPSLGDEVRPGTLTIAQPERGIETAADLAEDVATYGFTGHSGSLQPVSRLRAAVGPFPKGSTIPVRADFNTADNPFFYSSDPARDGWAASPSPGVHFLSFVPTSGYFVRLRAAMDGGGTSGSPAFEQFTDSATITATHRQNFLVPPRRLRSFPLVELLE